MHDLLKKVVDYVKLNSALKYMNFWYDFKLASFFKTKLKICKEFVHFYKFIFIKKIIKKKIWLIGAILIIFHNKLQKKSFKNSFIWKNYFGEKGQAMLMWGNTCGSL